MGEAVVATSLSPDHNGALGSDARLRVVIAEDSYFIREVLTMTFGSVTPQFWMQDTRPWPMTVPTLTLSKLM